MMVTLPRADLMIALAVLAFSAGFAAGHGLAIPLASSTPDAPAMIGGTPNSNGSVNPQRCSSTLGPEDYETCKVYFGD